MKTKTFPGKTLSLALSFLFLSIALSGCGKPEIAGPTNVPGTSVHDYRIKNCTGTPTSSATVGRAVGGTNTIFRVHWNAGPAKGSVKITCTNGTTSLPVNIVRIVNAGDVFKADKPVIDRGQEATGEKKRIAGFDPAQGGVIFGANITMAGAGKDKISVGIVQVLRKIVKWQATYDGPPSPLIAKFKKSAPWVDATNNKAPPVWYDKTNALLVGKNGMIVSSDAPQTGWPATNSNGKALITGVSDWKFDTYIVTQTSDAPDVFTIVGELTWSFKASISKDEVAGTYKVTGMGTGPAPRPAGKILPPYFTPVTSGKRLAPSTGITAQNGIVAPNRSFSK